MSKQGTGYLRLIGAALGLLLGLSGLLRLLPRESYALYTPPEHKVGDEEHVSGFVLRYEEVFWEENFTATPAARLSAGRYPAGYYAPGADGYEALLSPAGLDRLCLSDLQELQPQAPRPGSFRLVTGQVWYFACPLPIGRLEDCAVGQSLLLCLEGEEFPMEIFRLAPGNEEEFLLILRCDRFLSRVLDLRKEEGSLVFSTQEGLLLPKKALYFLEGKTGVYVLRGGKCRFKAVEILALEGESVLVKEDKSSTRGLRSEDQVILTEKEIYEGKVLP